MPADNYTDIHPLANIFPLMSDAEFSQLKNDIVANGLIEPIVICDGMVLDGRNRLKACRDAAITPLFCEYDGDDPTSYVVSLNLHRRHLSDGQRASIAAKLADMKHGGNTGSNQHGSHPANLQLGTSRAEAAALLNVSERSVNTAKQVQRAGVYELNEAMDAGAVSVSGAAALSDLSEGEQLVAVAEIAAGAKSSEVVKAHVAYNSGNNEWYTPRRFIDSARAVMGSIDLDPASSHIANHLVNADAYFTEDDNGLVKEWFGNVWLNPPYSQPAIWYFSDKIVASIPYIKSAIVMVNNATETRWFQSMAVVADAICLPAKRVRFLDPEGNEGAPLQGQAVLYFGADADSFCRIFRPYGVVLKHG
jgi:ParB family chromosome partitioning protein